MKNYYFNLQSKGGSGKSLLTYLQGLKHENDDTVAFVDLDAASHTTTRQLSFIGLKERLFEIKLLDDIKRIDREKFFKMIEGLNVTTFKDIYVDFGSSESEQILHLFSMDFSIDDLKLFETEMEARFAFNIIIAGGTSYEPCFQFLKQLLLATNGKFDAYVFINEFTFRQHTNLIQEVNSFSKSTKGLIKEVKLFGNIYPERQSGIEIISNIKNGLGLDNYKSFPTKIIIRNELNKI
jgi:hypothetical protein